ncbi:hypothetical protein P7C70_g4896, partial [Phenoliferia sp. Uapishka_3]
MLFSSASLSAIMLGLLSATSALARNPESHSELANKIRSRQAHISARSPNHQLEKRGPAVVQSLQSAQSSITPHTNAIQSLCGQISSANTAQRINIGQQINSHISQCHQIISNCGGSWGNTPKPRPSGISGGGGSTPSTCSAAATAFTGCVTPIQACGITISNNLRYITLLEESIIANWEILQALTTLDVVAEELVNLLDGCEKIIPGVTEYTAT